MKSKLKAHLIVLFCHLRKSYGKNLYADNAYCPYGEKTPELEHFLSVGGHDMGDAPLCVAPDVVRGPGTVIHLREYHGSVVGGSGKEKKPIFDISHLTLRKRGW